MVVLDHHKVLEGNSGNVSSSETLRKPSPILAFSGVQTTAAGGSMLQQRNAILNMTTTTAFQSSPYIQPLPTDSEVRTIMWSIIFN